MEEEEKDQEDEVKERMSNVSRISGKEEVEVEKR